MSRRNGEPTGVNGPGQQRALPQRFFKTVTVAAALGSGDAMAASPDPGPPAEVYGVLLDGKSVRTPAKGTLALPTRALAEAIAAEWQAQGPQIDPERMPLTRLANAAIDGVVGRQALVGADIVKYLGSDLVCYRAADPAALVKRQADAWDPVLAWCRTVLGIDLKVTRSIVPLAQPEAAGAVLTSWLQGVDAFALTALHAMTTLLGSAALTLAYAGGQLDAAAAWAAAHIDEDFQWEQWGIDALAKARRERQWAELEAASRLFELARPGARGKG